MRSNLEIPQPIARFLSLYLLMALCLKGGFALSASGPTRDVVASLACALVLAALVPALGYQLLKRWLNGFDAAAVAATYGSVSAVTFITAVQHLDNHGLDYGGHMAAAMALMESPAIILAVVLANRTRNAQHASGGPAATDGAPPLRKILHESLTDGAQLLLLGAMVVRHAIPEANPSLFIGMSLGLTFPFNILVGIPLYTAITSKVLGSG